jgi:hypothetical protein
MFKRVSQLMAIVGIFYFGPSTPSISLPYPFASHHPFFNRFQYTSFYPLPSHLILLIQYYWCCIILFSFPSLPEFQKVSSTITSMFYIWACIWSCLFLCIWLSLGISSTYESFCVSDPGLCHATWCSPVTPIYFQITCHYSLWWSNTPLCLYSTFSWSIHQL